MTTRDQETIGTIARAMCDSNNGAGTWNRITASRAQNNIGTNWYIDRNLDNARAALAAMPQPIGYGIHIESAGEQEMDESVFTTSTPAARKARLRNHHLDHQYSRVVTLVPIEENQ